MLKTLVYFLIMENSNAVIHCIDFVIEIKMLRIVEKKFGGKILRYLWTVREKHLSIKKSEAGKK